MKRVLSIALSLLLLLGVLSGCSLYYKMFGYDTKYTGPVYYMYLGEVPTSLDPASAYLNDASIAIMSMLYEGLYKYDEKGNVVEGMAKECKKLSFDEKTGELELEITIRDSRWNDHRYVQAEQFIYAWRRILDPASESPAASLLYDIKNAKAIKTAADMTTKFDLGVSAVDTRVMHITLVGKQLEDGTYSEPSVSAFKAKLASPLLVPVRDDMISKLADWATGSDTMASNGPFYLRNYVQKEDIANGREARIVLQRNVDYLRDDEVDPLDTYVKPYQIVLRYSVDRATAGDVSSSTLFASAGEQAAYYFDHGALDYLGYIPLSLRGQYKDKVTLTDPLFTHTYLFNTKNPLFSKPEVRRALSLAIDRDAIADTLVYAKSARTIVSSAAKEPGSDDAFIDHLTNGVSSRADVAAAKELLRNVGVEGGSFSITIKAGDENMRAVAEYCRKVWTEELGFDVDIVSLQANAYNHPVSSYPGYYDTYVACYLANGGEYNRNGPYSSTYAPLPGFDVIAVDLLTNSPDPFTTYAQFSKYFSGMPLDMTQETEQFDPALPITSYDNSDYNALINAAYDTPIKKAQAEYLHAADRQLMEDLPVMPLVYMQSCALSQSYVRDVVYSLGGVPHFEGATYKNYDENRVYAELQEAVVKARKDELG